MKGFALDNNGDVLIRHNHIEMVYGNELIRQTVRKVLQTNKNEWFLNLDEGITFSNILGKNVIEEIIKNEIEEGLSQVDDSFFIESFTCSFDSKARKLSVSFVAKNENGDTIEEVNEWA